MPATFLGYMRPDGRVGVRNGVGILSAMDNANPVTRAICAAVSGTIPITTLFVRGQFGRDEQITVRTLVGLGAHPNLAACLVVGLETTTTMRLVDQIAATGKPVDALIIQQEGGTVNALSVGIRKAMALVRGASALRPVPVSIDALTIGVECGGSDTTSGVASNPTIGHVADRIVDAGGRAVISETSEFLGAEHLFAERAVNASVKEKIIAAVLAVEESALKEGVDMRGSNPVPDNIRGGLTTIEEKALGAMVKSGTRPVQGVLDYAQYPDHPGCWMMDTPAPAVESMTGLAAGGCQIILFSTGIGNTIGSAIAPTIKITGNVNTARRFQDNVDVDVSDILSEGKTVEAAGDDLMGYLLEVASGTMTSSEILKQVETGISRFGPTV